MDAEILKKRKIDSEERSEDDVPPHKLSCQRVDDVTSRK